MNLRLHMGKFGELPDYRECWAAYDSEQRAMGTWCPSFFCNSEYKVVAIVDGDVTICFMTYRDAGYYSWKDELWCTGAWCRPEYRRMGFYNTLIWCWTNEMRKQDVVDGMVSGAHKKNKVSWAMQMSQGREQMDTPDPSYNKSFLHLRPTGQEVADVTPVLKRLEERFKQAA